MHGTAKSAAAWSEVEAHSDSEEVLFQAWCDGQERAFDALFRRLSPSLMGLLRGRGFALEEALDLQQTVFLQLHRGRDSFRPGARLRPWLYAIARNAGHALRSRSRAPVLAAQPRLESQCEAVEARLVRDEQRKLVREALARLPGPQRQAIELHWLQGMDFREVAQLVGSTPGAVKLRAHRGRQRLRCLLAERMCA